jgi:hypothetical protein
MKDSLQDAHEKDAQTRHCKHTSCDSTSSSSDSSHSESDSLEGLWNAQSFENEENPDPTADRAAEETYDTLAFIPIPGFYESRAQLTERP